MTTEELSAESFPIDQIDQLADRIYTKHGNKYSVESLRVYKSRINRVVTDYKKYGVDAKSMASWNPLTNQRKRTIVAKEITPGAVKAKEPYVESSGSSDSSAVVTRLGVANLNSSSVVDLHLPLLNDRSVVIYYPTDLTEDEAVKLGAVLKSIAALNG